MCLSSFDDLSAALAKLEEFSAKAKLEFGEGSEQRWGAESDIAQLLSIDLGRTENGLARFKAAMAKADPSWSFSSGSATHKIASMHLLLAQLEAAAGHVQEGRRALAVFEANRPPPGESGVASLDLNVAFLRGISPGFNLDLAPMMWDYPRFAAYIQLGDGARVLPEMEQREAAMPVSALAALYKLEDELGNTDRAHQVLAHAAELGVAAAQELVSMGSAPPALAASYLLSIESYAARDALNARPPRDDSSLALWLAEERKALVGTEIALPFGEGMATTTLRETIRSERVARAATFMKAYDGLPDRAAAFCNKSSVDLYSENDARTKAERELFEAKGRTSRYAMAWMMSAPYGPIPQGSPAALLSGFRARLAPGSVFLGFLRFRHPNAGWLMPAQDPAAEVGYVAFVVDAQRIEVIDLGPAAPIEAAIEQATKIPSKRPALMVEPPDADVEPWKDLYNRLWRPLERSLGRAQLVIVSPDGPLGRVPLAALHDGKRWLQERLDIAYVRSARDLLRSESGGSPSSAPLIFADPLLPPAPNAYSDFSNLQPLDTAREEGQALQKLIPDSVLLEGAAADERALLTARSPRIVHVASHGFLLPLVEPRPTVPSSFIKALAPREGRTLSFSRKQDELWMRSGLLLSIPALPSGPWDGLATAYEIMSTDMRGTELVTLSACQTGTGAVYGRSGLASMQAAFLNAGAASVVGSLWQVDTHSAVKWMETFYSALMTGKSRVAATRAAMTKTRTDYPHPFHWAPFVLMGATGPLADFGGRSVARP